MNKKLEELIAKSELSEEQMRALIKMIKEPEIKENVVKHYHSKKHTKIGILSDTHIGSKYTNYNDLEDLFKRFNKEGVEAVYHCGDITEGYGRRKSQVFEVDMHGADEQVAGVINYMPELKNGKIYFILGDHDSWHKDNAGHDIGKAISMQRSDLVYLGLFNATIEFAKNSKLQIVHPGKGSAYAISYYPQKMIEAMEGGTKPNIIAIGHFHKAGYFFYRNVHALLAGCLQNQTPWMRRMNLAAHRGGWILDLYHKRNGEIDFTYKTYLSPEELRIVGSDTNA